MEEESRDMKSTIFTVTAQRVQIWKSSRLFGQSTMVRSDNFRYAYLADRKRRVPLASPFALVRLILSRRANQQRVSKSFGSRIMNYIIIYYLRMLDSRYDW